MSPHDGSPRAVTAFFWLVIANMVVMRAWGQVVVWRIWSCTDRSVPYFEFCSVASVPLSQTWRGAYVWPGTLDPDVARYWRDLAMRAWIRLMLGTLLQFVIAVILAWFFFPQTFGGAG